MRLFSLSSPSYVSYVRSFWSINIIIISIYVIALKQNRKILSQMWIAGVGYSNRAVMYNVGAWNRSDNAFE